MYKEWQRRLFMRRIIRINIVNFLIIFLIIGFTFSCESKEEKGDLIYTSSGIIAWPPVISPDGKWLSFVTFSVDDPTKITLINLQNNELLSYPQEGHVYGPVSWLADNSAIVFAADRVDHKHLKIENFLKEIVINKKKELVISKNYEKMLFAPAVSNTGNVIFLEFTSQKEIVDGREYHHSNLWYLKKNMTTVKIAEGLLSLFYGWIDDDICFLRVKKEGNKTFWDLYLKKLDTGKEILLAEKVAPVYLLRDNQLFYFRDQNKKIEIEKLSLKNFKKISLGTIKSVTDPSISPDGSKIVFMRKNQVWVCDLSSEEEKQMTKTEDIKKYPLWTKDGKYIIYCTNQDLIKIKMDY
jgi:Tol biopolymer transport system component